MYWKAHYFHLTLSSLTNSEVKWSESCLVVSESLRSHGLYSPSNSLGQNTGVGSLSVIQGIFPTQGSNPGHCRWILYQLSRQGSPGILEWVAYSFSSGTSQPRNRTGVSCIAGGFFTSWATREAHLYTMEYYISKGWRREWQTTLVFLPWEPHEQYEKLNFNRTWTMNF